MGLVATVDNRLLALLGAILAGGCDGLFRADGRVVSASGQPLADVAISAYDDTMRIATRTDERGCFHLGRICSPFKHKVPLRVGPSGSPPVATVDGPVMNLRLLITVSDEKASSAAKVETGVDLQECAVEQSGATSEALSNKPLQRTALARRR
jgi:hypothetical protein